MLMKLDGSTESRGCLVIPSTLVSASWDYVAVVRNIFDDWITFKYLSENYDHWSEKPVRYGPGANGFSRRLSDFNSTPLDDFGVEVWTDGCHCVLRQKGESKAVFENGEQRPWVDHKFDKTLLANSIPLNAAILRARNEEPTRC